MKMLDRQRRATHIDELERYQLEEAIRESFIQQPPGTAGAGASAGADMGPPPVDEATAALTTSPRTTQLLAEVEEITL
eukprot:5944767-Alexandrium_andersonii.AAC.1